MGVLFFSTKVFLVNEMSPEKYSCKSLVKRYGSGSAGQILRQLKQSLVFGNMRTYVVEVRTDSHNFTPRAQIGKIQYMGVQEYLLLRL